MCVTYKSHPQAPWHCKSPSRQQEQVFSYVTLTPGSNGLTLQLLKRVLTTGVAIWPGGRNRREFFQELAAKTHQTLPTSFHNPSLSLHVWPEVMAELFEELEVCN